MISAVTTHLQLLSDGRLVAAAEEERFTRRKHDSAFPVRSIDYCLKCAGLSMEQVDFIAFPEMPFRSGSDSYLAEMNWKTLFKLRSRKGARFRSLMHKGLLDALLPLGIKWNWQMEPAAAEGFAQLRRHYPNLPPIHFYDHHQAHAAAAFLTSGADAAAIVTIDFAGGPYSAATWKGQGSSIVRLDSEVWQNSLANSTRMRQAFLVWAILLRARPWGSLPTGTQANSRNCSIRFWNERTRTGLATAGGRLKPR